MLLQGALALVTGAGQGNGLAIAKGLAAHGAGVIATDINEASARQSADEITHAGGTARAFKLDVADVAICRAVADRVRSEIGAVAILVNHAGVCPRNTAAISLSDGRRSEALRVAKRGRAVTAGWKPCVSAVSHRRSRLSLEAFSHAEKPK